MSTTINNIKNETDENSIFIKQSEVPKPEKKLCYQTIIDSLPDPNFKEPNLQWRTKAVEWRWRFYKIGDKKVVEMSFLEPNSNERIYVDKNNNYIKSTISNEYDNYLVEEYYFYTNPEKRAS